MHECFLLIFSATRNVLSSSPGPPLLHRRTAAVSTCRIYLYFILPPKVKRFKSLCSLPVSLFPLKNIKMIESWDVHYTFKGRSPNNPLESHEIFSCIQVGDNSNPTVAKQAVGGKREFLGVVLTVPRRCLDWRWDSSQSVWILGKILSLQQGQGLKSTGVAQWFLHPTVRRWDPWASPFSHFPLVFWESSSVLPEPEGPWEQSWWI